ncbi:hypothetical protein CK203_065090 [Vitis vinifera]|uniref:Uncharacterized protein n=1 Tax=Vitis vinifera TaxID=29760 RepID=A0A438G2R1_VITVI|nr:hypothetical protein CK203_065090 [Vitis vinifera]
MFTLGTIGSMAHGIYYTCCISYMRAWVLIIGYLSLVSLRFYHPITLAYYVPCLKTTLRPWDQISSSTASMWTEVTCSRIDDSMLSDLRPILHFDAIQGHISVRMRFTDHEGVACLSLFARSRFILFDIAVILGWGYLRTDRIHLMPYWGIFPSFSHGGDRSQMSIAVSVTRPRYVVFASLTIVPELFVDMSSQCVRRSRLVESLLAISSSLRFAAACHTGAYFPHIVSLQSSVQSHRSFTFRRSKPSPLLSFGVQSYHRFSDRHSESHPQFRRSESLSLLGLTFRVIIIISQFRRSELSSVFRSTFRVAFSVSAFRVVIASQLRCSEPSSHFSQFRRSEPSSIFRSTFRVAFSVLAFRVLSYSQFDVQSHHHHFSVSAFRAIIKSSSSSLSFGVQSRHRFSDRRSESPSQFDVQSHHHHFSVSAFRAIISFRSTFRVASSVSAFRVVITSQLRCSEPSSLLLLVSAFRAIIGFQIDVQSRVLGFGVQSHFSESSSVFRSTFRVAFSVSAFRVVITSQLRCSEPSSLLLSVSAFRAIIGFQIDVQSRVLSFGVQSRHSRFQRSGVVITSQLRCSEPSSLLLLVSAFRAIIGFQIDVQSRVLGFGVQSRYHFSASVFRAIITTSLSFGVRAIIGFQIDIQSPLLGFGVQSRYHFSV